MTDKELLELAAKAAGIELTETEDGFEADYDDSRIWNPLTDDGDALRLAVKLRMSYCYSEIGVYLDEPSDIATIAEDLNGDPYAATRRAIVRAAAEIGKTL